MAKLFPIQTNFAPGEVSPRLYGRTDLEAYRAGLEACENMITTAQGGAYRRYAGEHRGDEAGNYGRLFTFDYKSGKDYLVWARDQLIQVYDKSGVSGGGLDSNGVVQNPSFDSRGEFWTATAPGDSAVTFVPGVAFLSSTTGNLAKIEQLTGALGTPNFTHFILQRLGGNEFDQNAEIRIEVIRDGSTVLLDKVTRQRSFYAYFGNQSGNTSFTVRVTNNEPGTTTGLTYVNVTNTLFGPLSNTLAAPWGIDELIELQVEMNPAGDAMYMVHPEYAPQKLTATPGGALGLNWALAAVSFTGAPARWTGKNWPATVGIFDGRAYWAGEPDNPETIVASKSNDFENVTTGANPDDGFEAKLATRGQIRWVKGLRNLLIGTATGEHIMTAQDGVITPSDRVVEQQSAFGSFVMDPPRVGNSAAYISPDQRKLRAAGYRWEEDAWVSNDLTFLSEHLGANRFLEVHFAQNPENLLWLVTVDGRLVSATYERQVGVLGWHVHPGEGRVVSASIVTELGRDILYVLRAITDGTTERVVLERLDQLTPLDSQVVQVANAPTTTWTRLFHLANRTVDVIRDDGGLESVAVDSSGNMTLSTATAEINAGFGFVSKLRTLPLEQSDDQGGTQMAAKRANQIVARLYESAVPTIEGDLARDAETGEAIAEGAIVSADVRSMDLGMRYQTRIELIQSKPYPFNILGLFWEFGADALS